MDDDGWDLHAVVRGCATSTTASSSAAAEDTPADANQTAASTGGKEISFDDGPSADEQPSMLSNLISFSVPPGDDSEHRARKRKRKNKKRVIEIREEELNNDGWAWRKYGQKAIKGSPYPRNYYRCSTTRACSARKQVERSVADASTFIVSYSGDHLHPRPTHLSSLTGTTRTTKSSHVVAMDVPDQPPCSSSSPPSTSSFSPAASLKEDETEMNN